VVRTNPPALHHNGAARGSLSIRHSPAQFRANAASFSVQCLRGTALLRRRDLPAQPASPSRPRRQSRCKKHSVSSVAIRDHTSASPTPDTRVATLYKARASSIHSGLVAAELRAPLTLAGSAAGEFRHSVSTKMKKPRTRSLSKASCPWVKLSRSGASLHVEDFLTFRLTRLSNALRANLTKPYLEEFGAEPARVAHSCPRGALRTDALL